MSASETSGFTDKVSSRWSKIDAERRHRLFERLAQQHDLQETIFQYIQEGVMVVSADGNVTYANRMAEALLGFEFSRLRGRPVERYLPDIDWAALSRNDEAAWRKLSSSEVEVFRPQHRILSLCAFPLPPNVLGEPPSDSDAAPAQGGTLAILRDITRERADAAEALQSDRMETVRLLAASLAHEIGNPLNALGIHLQLLTRALRSLEDPDLKKDLTELTQVATDEVQRLDLILSKFLRALRPEAPKFAPCNLLDVLGYSLRIMRTDLAEHRISVTIDHPEEPPKILGDASQLQQAFFNLVKNAVQATPDGGKLLLALTADDRDVTITFRDSGYGMDKEAFGHLFMPFHSAKPNGNGIGLTIVQRIVQDHGGRIDVSSKPGEGTCFRLVFPLAERRARLLSAPPSTP